MSSASASDDDETRLPEVVATHPPRFDPSDAAGFLAYLDEHGYAVIRSVANEDEVARALDLAWDFLERGDPDGRHRGDPPVWESDDDSDDDGDDGNGAAKPKRGGADGDGKSGQGEKRAEQPRPPANGLRRDDPSTWDDERWRARVSMPHVGIVNSGGVGQSPILWHLRTLPAVKQVFASIWGTDRLITSFDGMNVFRPWRGAHPERRTRGGWFHVDQGRGKPTRCCVQGLVTLTDATPQTGGLVVLPGSHKDFAGVVRRNGSFSFGDFIALSERDPLLRRPTAGDLLLWDSRMAHCNAPGVLDKGSTAAGGGEAGAGLAAGHDAAPPAQAASGAGHGDGAAVGEGSPERQDRLLRVVGYVCMTPARWASYAVLKQRRAVFAAKQTTTHWPHECHPSGDGLVDGGGAAHGGVVLPCERNDRAAALAAAPPDVRALVDGGYGESLLADSVCAVA